MVNLKELEEQLRELIPQGYDLKIDQYDITQIDREPYYMLRVFFPYNQKKPLSVDNCFAISYRTDTLSRGVDRWNIILFDMLASEASQRLFLRQQVEQARQARFLSGENIRVKRDTL